MKEAQMMTSEEAPGLLDRIRIDGRMTTARASDDGGVTAVSFSFWCGRKERKSKYFDWESRGNSFSFFDWESRPTAGDCRFVSWEGSNKSNRGKEAKWEGEKLQCWKTLLCCQIQVVQLRIANKKKIAEEREKEKEILLCESPPPLPLLYSWNAIDEKMAARNFSGLTPVENSGVNQHMPFAQKICSDENKITWICSGNDLHPSHASSQTFDLVYEIKSMKINFK